MGKIFYIAQVLNGINIIAIVALIVFVVITSAFFVLYMSDLHNYGKDDSETRRELKGFKRSLITLIVAALVIIFAPSRQTYLLMIGANAIENITKNDKVQETAGKTVEFIDAWLDSHIKEQKQNN